MSAFADIFNGKKKKEHERLHKERQVSLDVNLAKTTKVQEQNVEVQEKNLEIQKSAMEIAWKNQEQNEKLTNLVLDNERTKNLLLERENKIKTLQEELDERQKNIRQEEIEITAKKAENRKNEQQVEEQQKNLETESKRVKEREVETEKIKAEFESEKEKYQSLYDELEVDKGNIKTLEEEARRKNKDADEKTTTANTIFAKSKIIDEEIKAKEAKFETYRESIEKALNEKIIEYDRRLEDLNSVRGIVDDIKFDKSEEGKEAKLVVKEAIRQAKKALTDIKTRFEELDEKYSSGTFKGFATSISEIDKYFDELKTQYIQVKEHIASQDNLPPSISKWLDTIEECINNADKFVKSWEFSEAYRNIIWGLATCKNYELLLTILIDYAQTDEEENSEAAAEEEFIDWYVVLEIEPNATEKEIIKQFKKLIMKFHPDKAPEDKKEEYHAKAVLLNQAKDILCDLEKRKAFDEKRNNRK